MNEICPRPDSCFILACLPRVFDTDDTDALSTFKKICENCLVIAATQRALEDICAANLARYLAENPQIRVQSDAASPNTRAGSSQL